MADVVEDRPDADLIIAGAGALHSSAQDRRIIVVDRDFGNSNVVAPSMMFAEPDSDWVFNITASSDDMMRDVLNAFCGAMT